MNNITPIPALKDNYIWCLRGNNTQNVVVVDPGEAAPVLALLAKEQLILTAILITHHHWDHSGGIAELLQHYPVPVFGPAKEKMDGVSCPLTENDVVELPQIGLTLRVLDIPGHTLGHIAYYGHDQLFCGDTLFTGGCGRVFEGTVEQMYHSLSKLAALPDSTQMYCGHEYTQANLQFALAVEPNNIDLKQRIDQVKKLRAANLSTVPATLAEEKLTNPFLRCEVATVIAAAEKHAQQPLTDPVAVFACLRQWKNSF